MQVRWNFKLLPNQSQSASLEDWLVTLRKHRNYALLERKDGFETNNQDVTETIVYAYGAYCDIDSRVEYGSCCPLACPVLKHGVIPQNLELAFKESVRFVVDESRYTKPVNNSTNLTADYCHKG